MKTQRDQSSQGAQARFAAILDELDYALPLLQRALDEFEQIGLDDVDLRRDASMRSALETALGSADEARNAATEQVFAGAALMELVPAARTPV